MVLTKLTWLVAFPLWFLLWILWTILSTEKVSKTSLLQAAVLFMTAIYVVNSVYAFDGSFRQLKDYEFVSRSLSGNEPPKDRVLASGNRFENSFLGYLPVPLPAELVKGIDTQKRDFEKGMESYVLGTWSDRGWSWYYGYVLLLKEPLGFWGGVALASVITLFYRQWNAPLRDELILFIPMMTFFLFISSQNGISMHPRYIIPVLPFLYLFIAKSGKVFSLKNPLLTAVALICLIQYVGSSLTAYPHSMSYFNRLAGEPRQWPLHLLGSNISWGQDAYYLREWYEAHPGACPLYVSYSQGISLDKLGIDREGTVPPKLTVGWMVIDVNDLYERRRLYDWLKEHEPIDSIGNGIWVYRIDRSE